MTATAQVKPRQQAAAAPFSAAEPARWAGRVDFPAHRDPPTEEEQ